MKARKLTTGTAAALLAIAAAPAPAQVSNEDGPRQACALTLRVPTAQRWRGPHGRGYEVFRGNGYLEPLVIIVHHEGAPCRYSLVGSARPLGATASLTGPGGSLRFDVLRETNGGRSFLSADLLGDNASQIVGSFGEGASEQSTVLYVWVGDDQVVAGGSYAGSFAVRLLAPDDGLRLMDERYVQVATDVLPVIEAGFTNVSDSATRQANINFGELTVAHQQAVPFYVRSNAPFALSLVSAHRGALAHEQSGARAPYRLLVNGREAQLAAGDDDYTYPASGGSIQPLVLSFDVPAVPRGYPAGRYQDTLTVTFTALN